MKYATLGRTGLKVSRLGFGCMRLPMTADGKIDREQAIPLLHRAVDLGVNYFDTAVFYCNGDSQRVLGEALADRRDRVVLSTKNHMHDAPADAWWGRLTESLELLRTDHLDVYNCHGLSWDAWVRHINVPGGKRELLERARAQGKIRHISCSFHDSPEALVKLVETGFFESITVQYNLLNQSLAAAIHRARELNVGIVVMGPVGGGRLGVDSQRIRELTRHEVRSTPEAALRFVLAHPGVCVALSGMSNLEMLEQNVRTVSDEEPFTPAQIAAIEQEIQRVKAADGLPCTACGYCQPCPFGVDIPASLGVYNDYKLYGLAEDARRVYANMGPASAATCTECGACLPKCPQKIQIPQALHRVMAELDVAAGQFGAVLSVTGARNGSVKGRLTVKNLRPDPLAARVDIELDDGGEAKPSSFDFVTLAPMGTDGTNLNIRLPDGASAVSGRVRTVARDGHERVTSVHVPLFIIPSGITRAHDARLLAEQLSGREDILKTHGYCVTLGHDDLGIHVVLDVRSGLHALGGPGESRGARIEMYVDMRPSDKGFATAPYADGVEQFVLALGQAGWAAKSARPYALDLRHEPRPGGARLSFTLPFANFLKAEWKSPSIIGLDFMFVVHDADGRELGHPTYGGRQGLYQNPRAFTKAYLV